MKIITGQVPLLPWYRLMDMTDAEIKEFNYSHLVETEMKDDSLSDVQKEFKMIKRGDCRCICHNDFGPTVMHIMPCCETDDNLKVPLDMSKANCPHGIAMDIYCKKCYFENLKASSPSIVDEQIIYGGGRNSGKMAQSIYEKETWNAAIEAAAEKAYDIAGLMASSAIRSLKK